MTAWDIPSEFTLPKNEELRELAGATDVQGFLPVALTDDAGRLGSGCKPELTILPPAPFCYCMPWRLRDITAADGPWHGALCCFCELEIAAPASAVGKHVACVYCGLDRGDLPAVDVPLYDDGEARL